MDDRRLLILASRKALKSGTMPPTPQECAPNPSIAPTSNSSFVSLKEVLPPAERNLALRWSDKELKQSASRDDRVVLAVRDAARQAEAKGLNPFLNAIYVTSVIRISWNLTAPQLSKGLRVLEMRGAINFTVRKRGRHARFLLAATRQPNRHY